MRYLSEDLLPLFEHKELIELVLVDREGMVLDAEGSLYDPEHLAAIFSPVHRLLQDVRHQIHLEDIEEISVRTKGPRLRIVLQSFTIEESPYLLIALFPVTTFYRQVTSDVLRIVKDITRKLSHAHHSPPVAPPEDKGRRSGE